jgi:RNA polymerase sigma factor (sigma-70 family)
LPTVIHLVDDDAAFRKAMSRLLHEAGYEVAAFESARELLQCLPEPHEPSCILLDVQIPGLTGPELQKELITRGLELPIIFLTGHGDIPTSVQTMKAGADDFLTKPVPSDTLLKAIAHALARHRLALEEKAKSKALHELVDTLTPREREVFELVVQGRMNKLIAHQLGTTVRTIKAHRRRIMEKIEARSLADLVVVAERLGIRAGAKGAAATRTTDHVVQSALKDRTKTCSC